MWDMDNFNASHNEGGFMNSQSGNSGKKKDSVRRVQTVVPLLIRQILNSDSDEDFKLCGITVQIANIVGIVREYNVQSTKFSCRIEDHTGSIKGAMWVDDETHLNLPPVTEGSYVEVHGSIRNQDGNKLIMILTIVPIDDCNVITNHLLRVIYTRLGAEKLSQGQSVSNFKPSALPSVLNMSKMDTDSFDTSTITLSLIQDKIYKIIKASNEPSGIYRDVIMRSFKPNQKREVDNALDFMITEGHIYTTVDSDYFKAT